MITLLLVEDTLDLAKLIRRELEQQGYRVLHAADGQAALQLHAAEQPDLLILDWMLPGMDGLEILRRIRHSSIVPVLMLTARGEETDRVVGLELGADDYLTKPFSMRELQARVSASPVHRRLCRQYMLSLGSPVFIQFLDKLVNGGRRIIVSWLLWFIKTQELLGISYACFLIRQQLFIDGCTVLNIIVP